MADKWRMTLGDAIEQMHEHALADWRAQYAPSTRSDELFAEKVQSVKVELQVHRDGHASVMCWVDATKAYQSEVYYGKLIKDAGLWLWLYAAPA